MGDSDEFYPFKQHVVQAMQSVGKHENSFMSIPLRFRKMWSSSYTIAHSTMIYTKGSMQEAKHLSHHDSSNEQQTYSQYYTTSVKIARSLLDLRDCTVEGKEHPYVGIYFPSSNDNQVQLVHMYMACLMVGFVPLVINQSLFDRFSDRTDSIAQNILSHTLDIMIVNSSECVDRLSDCVSKVDSKKLHLHTVVLHPASSYDEPFESEKRGPLDIFSYEEFLTLGEYVSSDEVTDIIENITSEDAAIAIASQDKDVPLVVFSHGSILNSTVQFLNESIIHNLNFHLEQDTVECGGQLSSLCLEPLHLPMQQLVCIFAPIITPMTIVFIDDVTCRKSHQAQPSAEAILSLLPHVRPSHLVASSHIWKKVSAACQKDMFYRRQCTSWIASFVLLFLSFIPIVDPFSLSQQVVDGMSQQALNPLGVFSWIFYLLSGFVVSEVRKNMGLSGCLVCISYSQDSPFSTSREGQFFSSIGVMLQDALVHHEFFGAISLNKLGEMRKHSFGKVLDGYSIKVYDGYISAKNAEAGYSKKITADRTANQSAVEYIPVISSKLAKHKADHILMERISSFQSVDKFTSQDNKARTGVKRRKSKRIE